MVEWLIERWAEFGLILVIVGHIIYYILKKWVEWNLKQKEIYLSKTVEYKIAQIKIFYGAYINIENDLQELYHAVAQRENEHANEIRKKLKESWKSFKINLWVLKLYLQEDELNLLNQVNQELDEIHKKLDFVSIDQLINYIDMENIKEVRKIRNEVFPKILPELLEQIGDNLRKEFRR